VESDEPRGCWSLQLCERKETSVLRSLAWPGFQFFLADKLIGFLTMKMWLMVMLSLCSVAASDTDRPLPGGWVKVEMSGHTFYRDTVTGRRSWTHPIPPSCDVSHIRGLAHLKKTDCKDQLHEGQTCTATCEKGYSNHPNSPNRICETATDGVLTCGVSIDDSEIADHAQVLFLPVLKCVGGILDPESFQCWKNQFVKPPKNVPGFAQLEL